MLRTSTQKPILTDAIKQAVNAYKAKDFNLLQKLWNENKNNPDEAEQAFLHYLMGAAHLFFVKSEERDYRTAHGLLRYAGHQTLISDTYNYDDVASYMEIVSEPTDLLTEREQRILFAITMNGFHLNEIVKDNNQAWLNGCKSTLLSYLSNDFVFVFKDKETAAFLLEDSRILNIFKELKLDSLALEPRMLPEAYDMFILGYLYETGNNNLKIEKDPQKAADYYQAAIQSNDRNYRHPETACIFGKKALEEKDFDRAINLFESAFSRNQSRCHPEAALLLASAYNGYALSSPTYSSRQLAKVTVKEKQFNNASENEMNSSIIPKLTNLGITQEWKMTADNNNVSSNRPQDTVTNTVNFELK